MVIDEDALSIVTDIVKRIINSTLRDCVFALSLDYILNLARLKETLCFKNLLIVNGSSK